MCRFAGQVPCEFLLLQANCAALSTFCRRVGLALSRFAAVRFSHFLPSLLLLLGGVFLARLAVLNEFFTSLFNVLPTLLLLLGGAFCLVYGRQRGCFCC